MKAQFSATLLAIATCGFAMGQTVYTEPVGYSTQTLTQGFNCVGLTLHNQTLASGVLETVSGTALTDNELSFTPDAGRTYILEITAASDASLVGTIQEITQASISGTTITTPDNLGSVGVVAGDSYKIRLAPTLEEVFTTTSVTSGGVLQASLNSGTGDIVWVPSGPGTYNKYYLHAAGAFRDVSSNTASPNVPLIYADGIFVEKKGVTAASLTVAGAVKMVGTNSPAYQGFNLISIVSPAGRNLWNIGLEDDIQVSLNAGTADIVWVQQANLTYNKYYRHSSGNWREVIANVNLSQAEAEAIELPSCILVERKSATQFTIDLNGPQ